jgi:hypothetical protein
MSFLNRSNTVESNKDNSERQYLELFPKIGRDFIYREDFEEIIRQILSIVDPLGMSNINLSANDHAIQRAYEYSDAIEEDDMEKFRIYDLIDLED